jgi:hypothetical protein
MAEYDLPPAEPKMEAYARRMMADGITPGEFAARYSHTIVAFDMDKYRYSEPEVDDWIHQLGDILWGKPGSPRLEDLRIRYLTDEERRRIAEVERGQEF